MKLHLQSTDATLNGLSLDMLTALLHAMVVYQQHGFETLTVIRRETIPAGYGFPNTTHEALVIRHNGTANDTRMGEALFSEIENTCDLIVGQREMTIIAKAPR